MAVYEQFNALFVYGIFNEMVVFDILFNRVGGAVLLALNTEKSMLWFVGVHIVLYAQVFLFQWVINHSFYIAYSSAEWEYDGDNSLVVYIWSEQLIGVVINQIFGIA